MKAILFVRASQVLSFKLRFEFNILGCLLGNSIQKKFADIETNTSLKVPGLENMVGMIGHPIHATTSF